MYKKVAKQGNAQAHAVLVGVMQGGGKCTGAVKLYSKAAKQGDTYAQ